MENNEKWLTIFECARKISDLKPWKKFNDIDFFELRPYKKERIYISFLGKGKQVYGVVFYRGDEIVGVDEMSNLEYIPTIQRLRYQKCIVCYFDRIEALTEDEVKVIDDLGINVKDKTKHPHFRVYNPKYLPYMIEGNELDFLFEIFPILIEALDRFYSRNLKPLFHLFEVPVFSQTKQGNWTLGIKSLNIPSYPMKIADPTLLNINNLKSKKQLDYIIELDISYTNEVIKGADNRPLHARLALIANAQSGEMLTYKVVDPEEDNVQVYVNEFIKFINNFGLPQLCVVRDSEAYFALLHIAYLLGVNMSRSEELIAIDDFIESMQEFKNKPFTKLS